MRAVEQKPAAVGFVGTFVVWALIFLFFYLTSALFTPKQFKTIKIRLDAPSKTESTAKKAESAPAQEQKASSEQAPAQSAQTSETQSAAPSEVPPPPPAPKVENVQQSVAKPSTPAPAPKKESAKPKSEPKPAPKKTEPKTAPKKTETPKPTTQKTTTKPAEQPKPVEQTLQKSMEELMAEQQQRKTPKKEFDWSQFDDIEGTSSQSSTAVAKNTPAPTNTSALSGSVASSSNASSTATSAASTSARASANQSASSATSNALAQAVSAKRYSSSSGGVSSSVTANTGSSSDGKVSLQMSDGTPRVLLEPEEPKIVLSAEAAALIDSTKRLSVSFTVTASGNVPVTSVKISPDILPSLVTMEIREQISRWRFASAPYEGSARFDYTIQKN